MSVVINQLRSLCEHMQAWRLADVPITNVGLTGPEPMVWLPDNDLAAMLAWCRSLAYLDIRSEAGQVIATGRIASSLRVEVRVIATIPAVGPVSLERLEWFGRQAVAS